MQERISFVLQQESMQPLFCSNYSTTQIHFCAHKSSIEEDSTNMKLQILAAAALALLAAVPAAVSEVSRDSHQMHCIG